MIMAGMLPGVECARRRRFRRGGSAPFGSRRSSFCLYASNHEHRHHLITSYSVKGSTGVYNNNSSSSGAVLGGAAREAKQRLDERLNRKHWRQRNEVGRKSGGELEVTARLLRDVLCWKRRMWSWALTTTAGVMGWKARVEEECVVCLEGFGTGDVVVKLPCAHCFHRSCVLPWLRRRSTCPCCRTQFKSC